MTFYTIIYILWAVHPSHLPGADGQGAWVSLWVGRGCVGGGVVRLVLPARPPCLSPFIPACLPARLPACGELVCLPACLSACDLPACERLVCVPAFLRACLSVSLSVTHARTTARAQMHARTRAETRTRARKDARIHTAPSCGHMPLRHPLGLA
jgi:hypothetical protein